MTVTSASLAAGNLVGVKNEQFAVQTQVLPQKIAIIGTYDESTYTGITPNVPIRVYSAEDVGAKTGFGFMLHRLAKYAYKPGKVETWIIPQAEGGSDAIKATGSINLSASTGVKAGTLALYVNFERVAIVTSDAETGTAIAAALAAKINAMSELPVTALANTGVITLTSKSAGDWGNDITVAFNLSDDDEMPTGVSAVITAMHDGAGVPDIQDALDALGTGDGQNGDFFTVIVHGYGSDSATLNALSTYNGVGNYYIGNYKKEIGRPFRALIGDTATGSAGLSAALVLAGGRRTDRTNGIISAPGSYSHPQEIAAQMSGLMAVTNSSLAEEGYIDKSLDGISTGEIAGRWTNDYDNRDQAVQGGVGTTFVKNGVLYAQNIITFYRPADVSPSSNGYRAMRNISILQNLLYNYRMNFEREKWKGISIVADTAEVSDTESRKKARDVDAVMDDLLALADSFAGKAWIYSADYTKGELQKGGKVTLRSGLTGFDIEFPVILSGEGGIFNSVITFDTSIAVLL